ncbi:FAD-dependent oxidoreductase [Plantibacter flavus]|uniref:FAD-dependent oxidoreductase n=1 Tax=Plantibacter flavus TaxID=150123 RepID=UPI003F15E3E9
MTRPSAGTGSLTVDFLIVGSGGGGLAAAIAAKDAGLDTLVVEKESAVGGSTAMSGGMLWVPANELMTAQGVPDSTENAMVYMESLLGEPTLPTSLTRRRAFVTAGNEVVSLLRREGVQLAYSDGYSDYFDTAPGGVARGRSIESKPWNAKRLGPWRSRVVPGMATHIGLVLKTNEMRSVQFFNRALGPLLSAVRIGIRTFGSRLLGQDLWTNGAGLIGQMLNICLRENTPVWTDSPLEELLVENGRVVGARIKHRGELVTVRARQGVLLAAGGFARNARMRHEYSGAMPNDGQWSTANPGDTGEVMRMAMALGAKTDLLDVAWWLPSTQTALGVSTLGQARQRPGAILVSRSGERFVNESTSMIDVAKAMYAAKSVPCWSIFDDAYRARYSSGVGLPGAMPKEWLKRGWVRRADSLEELAALIGAEPATLRRTVDTFNEHAREGRDPAFGRGASNYDRSMGDPGHKPNPALGPLEKGPFYAYEIYPADAGTGGGLVTDEHARVLGVDDLPIPGLYATGNTTATVLGRSYFGAGASISYALAFGYLAARHAANPHDAD